MKKELFLSAAILCCATHAFPQNIIKTIAGNGLGFFSGDGGPGPEAQLQLPTVVRGDNGGNIYIGDGGNHRIRKVNAAGIITTIAGNGVMGSAGDNGPATACELSSVYGIAIDAAGNIFFADATAQNIRRIDAATGTITTIAGTGKAGYTGDGGPASAATLNFPEGLCVDAAGDIFFADALNNSVREIDAVTNTIHTVAGSPTGVSGYTGDGGPATDASFYGICSVSLDAGGDLYIADGNNNVIREVDATTGVVTTIAGGHGELSGPTDVYVDATGEVYIADFNHNQVKRLSRAFGTTYTIAGTTAQGYNGDGMAATKEDLYFPTSVYVNPGGDVYIADQKNERVRKVDAATGIMTTMAGNGSFYFAGDGGAAVNAELYLPSAICKTPAGDILMADYNNRIRKIDGNTHVITTIAGNGLAGYNGDGIPATSALTNYPGGLCADAAGNIYFTDAANSRIRKIDAAGIITTIGGNGVFGRETDGVATAVPLLYPVGICVTSAGDIYFTSGYFLRKITAKTGMMTTVSGTSTLTYYGDGTTAFNAGIGSPSGLCVDQFDNIYISDDHFNAVRMIDAKTGIITTVAGNQYVKEEHDYDLHEEVYCGGYSGDGGSALSAELNGPAGIFVNRAQQLFIADVNNNVVRVVDLATGVINTYAGNGYGAQLDPLLANSGNFSGDGGLAINAELYAPSAVCADKSGLLLIADTRNSRIRSVADPLVIKTVTNENTFSLAPNPCAGVFTVTLSDKVKDATLEVYNMLGEKVYASSLSAHAVVDISSQPSGVYLAHVMAGGQTTIRKVVLQH